MTCLIADDNKLALTVLQKLLAQINDIQLVAICKNAIEAFEYLKEHQTDLAILDVEMPGMTGVELVQALPQDKRPSIILLTANPQYAADAFELEVTDYIIKPVTLPRLLKSVEKIKQQQKSESISVIQQSDASFIFIKDKGSLTKIDFQDILFAEAMGDYVKIHTSEKWYTVNTSMRELEDKYKNQFTRVHRSYIVVINKIQKIEEGVIFIEKHRIPLAESFKKSVLQQLNLL
jgi:DNA-binding LytR/AlgR family response regulator